MLLYKVTTDDEASATPIWAQIISHDSWSIANERKALYTMEYRKKMPFPEKCYIIVI